MDDGRALSLLSFMSEVSISMEERLLEFYELLAREAGKLAKQRPIPAPPRKDPAREQRKSATLREMPRERTA